MDYWNISEPYSWVLATVRDIKRVPCCGKILPDEQKIHWAVKGAMDQAYHDGRSMTYLVKNTLKELGKTDLHIITRQRVCDGFAIGAQMLGEERKINPIEMNTILDLTKKEKHRLERVKQKYEKIKMEREGLDNLLGVGVKSDKEIEREVKRREREGGW